MPAKVLAMQPEEIQSESRFLAARAAWDHEWNQLARQRTALFWLLLVSLIAHVGQAIGTMWAYENAKPQVVLAEVDRLSEQASYPLDVMREPSARLISSELARWIEGARTVTPDPSLQKKLNAVAYGRTSRQVERVLNNFYRDAARNPFLVSKDKRIEVEVVSVQPLDRGLSETDTSETWLVRWRETHKPLEGRGAETIQPWTANVTFALREPPNTEAARENPAGLYVTGLHWSRERGLEPQRR